MMKSKFMKQQRGVIAIYAISTILCFLLILGAIFISTNTVRRSQLKTALKVKEVYGEQTKEASQIAADRRRVDTSGYVQDSSLQVFYDAINNMGSSHSNNTKIWRDLSSNQNDAIKQGSGQLNWNEDAYDFTNQNQNYFESKNPISLGTSSRTTEVVFTLEEDGVRNLAGFGTLSSVAMNDFYMSPDAGLNWHVYGNPANEGISGALLTGKIYSTTITYDDTTKKTNYYTNSTSKTDVSFYNLNTGSSALTIGIGKYGVYNTDKRFKIKAFRIYNRALTPAEREQNYQLDKARYSIAE